MKKNFKNLIILIIGILVVATVFFAIKASAEGQTLITLEDKAQALVAQNQELNSEIVNSTSLSQIAKAAQAMGMVQPEKYAYMKGTGVAMR